MSHPDANAWLAAIVESSDDAIIGKRLDGTVVSWNEGATRIFGYTADEMIGRSVLQLFPPELRDSEADIVGRISRGERVDHYETMRVHKDGKRIEISLSVSPIRNAEGRIVGAAKIARDVTEEKRLREEMRALNKRLNEHTVRLKAQSQQLDAQATELEQQLEQTYSMANQLEETNAELSGAVTRAKRAQEDAEAANRVKSEFLATMSHELRTPLNAIGGYADLMEAELFGDLSPEYHTYLDRIKKSHRHLLNLISSLLDYAKVESGNLEVELGPVSVADVLAQIEPMAAPQAKAKQQRLRIRLPDKGLLVRADFDRALQILMNLVGNAIKFTPPGGSIKIGAAPEADRIVLEVGDTGPGIPPSDAERIFKPFVQLERPLRRSHDGTGLGLAISRELARSMGGDVTLKSKLGRGSTFMLALPKAD